MNMMSLYDYLGKAAGPALGKRVSDIASKRNIKRDIRMVETSRYVGKIFLYPETFLQQLRQEKVL